MRGTPRIGVESAASPGIIPAYAGNTGVIDLTGQRFEDHPRVCGEHLAFIKFCAVSLGSSPRMRGTPIPRIFGTLFDGIIPAYAGNTTTRSARKSATRDHPRVCGEHRSAERAEAQIRGSSPRMRGTRWRGHVVHQEQGIIPAYAGNTLSWGVKP